MTHTGDGEARWILKGGQAVTPDAVLQTDVVLEKGAVRLGAAAPPAGADAADHVVDVSGKYILPGFVDIHFHGYRLFDFTVGMYDPKSRSFDSSADAYREGFALLEGLLPSFGVTGLFVATFAYPIGELRRCLGRLREHMNDHPPLSGPADAPAAGTRIHGGLLEGTFLNPGMAGAQNPEHVFPPSLATFDALEDGGSLRLVNVVPDFGEKSFQLTRRLTERGIVVGAGHTDATARQVREAVQAGLRYVIHFTNGPTGGSYKPFEGGGAVEGILRSDELFAELIADGYHVNPAYVRDIIARKGAGRIIAVTDAIYASGSDLRELDIGGVKGRVSEDGRVFSVVGKKNTLFSSNLNMIQAFQNLLNWQTVELEGIWHRRHPALPLEEALLRTAGMCAANPCRLAGLAEEGFGRVADGMRPDLVVLDVRGEPGSFEVEVDMTLVDGRPVYARDGEAASRRSRA